MKCFILNRLRCHVALMLLAMGAVMALPGSAQAADDGRLSAIGGLSAAHMYTTYIAIGATADAFGNDVYETEQVQDIMSGMVGMIDTLNCCSFRKTARTKTTSAISTTRFKFTTCFRKRPDNYRRLPKLGISQIIVLMKKPVPPSGLALRNFSAWTKFQ